jgi:hypothetical protein
MIEYEKLQVIKCEDVDSFSSWATAGNKQEYQPAFDKIETKHFSSSYCQSLEEYINAWIEDMYVDYSIVDIDIKYNTLYLEYNRDTRYSALVILKLKYL